jgi:hypothetical protein
MAWWEQSGIWHIIISLATLALVIFGIVWGNNLWGRREKIKIKFSSIDYKVDPSKPEIKVYWGAEFQRSGAKDARYIKQILLRPDKETYGELSKYFTLPRNGLIEINDRLELPRDTIVSSIIILASYPIYPALPALPRDAKQRDKAKQVADELSQKPHAVGLVWEDTGKTTWKIIRKEDYGRWV